MTDKIDLSVIIPVYNEAKTCAEIIKRVQAISIVNEIIVVDDASTDGTIDILEAMDNIKVIRHEKNKGKGAAVRTGLAHVQGNYVITQDADLEYDPADFVRLIEPIEVGRVRVVYGYRDFVGQELALRVGNRFLTGVANLMYGSDLRDMETCYKVFKVEVLRDLKFESNRFGFEPEVTAKISKIPEIRIYEVGISYYGRTYKEGKKINWRDGLRALYCILKYNL